MSSSTNQFPPWPPYETYRDCSQGICNIYCPQWCYLMFPPPPPSRQFSSANDSDGGDSSSDFSPLIIAVIGILASAFILITYYTIISKYCRRRRGRTAIDEIRDHHNAGDPNSSWMTSSAVGLEESVIKSITVLNYRKDDGVVEGSDCSVCLSEFEEEEKIRLLPQCHHAFHVPCIDAWLKSHATCPLCRANINGSADSSPSSAVVVRSIPLPPEEAEQQMVVTLPPLVLSEITAAVEVDDIECGGQSEESEDRERVSEMRRSSSLNFEGVPVRMMKRSVSTGRFVLMSRDGNSSSNTIPV